MSNQKLCRHIYEYVYQDICPDCGRYTHEPNTALENHLFRKHYEERKDLPYKCPIDGGTIRGWWSI